MRVSERCKPERDRWRRTQSTIAMHKSVAAPIALTSRDNQPSCVPTSVKRSSADLCGGLIMKGCGVEDGKDAPFDIVRERGPEIGERHSDEKNSNVDIVRTH